MGDTFPTYLETGDVLPASAATTQPKRCTQRRYPCLNKAELAIRWPKFVVLGLNKSSFRTQKKNPTSKTLQINGLQHHQVTPTKTPQKSASPPKTPSFPLKNINQLVFFYGRVFPQLFKCWMLRTPGISHLGRWVRSPPRSKWSRLQAPIGPPRPFLPSPIPTSSRRSSSEKTRISETRKKKNKVTIDIWLMGGQRKGEKNSSSTKKNKWIFESVAPFLTYVFLTERFWFLVLFDFQDVFCGSFLDCLTPEWPGLRLATLFQEICFPKPLGARSLATSKYI